jgi:hypothetical protein
MLTLAKLLTEKLGTVSPSTPTAIEGASVETAGIDEDLAEADLDA